MLDFFYDMLNKIQKAELLVKYQNMKTQVALNIYNSNKREK